MRCTATQSHCVSLICFCLNFQIQQPVYLFTVVRHRQLCAGPGFSNFGSSFCDHTARWKVNTTSRMPAINIIINRACNVSTRFTELIQWVHDLCTPYYAITLSRYFGKGWCVLARIFDITHFRHNIDTYMRYRPNTCTQSRWLKLKLARQQGREKYVSI